MGYQLWKSTSTGVRRNGTTFKELQDLFINNITTKFICEPIFSCKLYEDSIQVRDSLEMREFDIVGVIDDNKKVIGFAVTSELEGGCIESYRKEIPMTQLISDSTPVASLLEILSQNTFAFVLQQDSISGIVTIADINKPIVRIYLFGIISLFELHLNYWINKYYNEESWRGLLKKARIDAANKIYSARKGNNDDLSLLECIQLGDKKAILRSCPEFLKEFEFSKSSFKRLLEDIEKIRNELAHSQNSIISNLKYSEFAETISNAESFLSASEAIVVE